jgi:cytochrome P450
MQLTPDNAICSQRLAQKLLSSPKMLPPTLKPFLLRLQRETDVDFARLIQLSDHILTFMSGESHQKIKNSLAKSLGKNNLQSYERKIYQAGNFLVKSLQRVSGSINLTKDIEDPLFLYIVKEIFGYQPKSDEALIKGIDIAVRFTEPMQSVRTLIEVQSVFDQLTTEISAQINTTDACGLIHDISQGLDSDNVDSHSKEQVATMIATLIVATRTTSETLSNILIENSRLNRAERKRFSDEHWVKNNIDDLIRFCASNAYLTRTAAQDLNVDEHQIAKNDDVLIHIPSSNRDSSYYDNCDYAKLSDQLAKRHLSFGAGIHRCPGALLATMILSHVLPSLYQQFPDLRVDTNKLTYKATKMTTRLRSAPVTLY